MVFVDLETSGANFANDRIIEIGIVRVDSSGVEEWSSLVDPALEVSPFITGLTGISTAMLVGAPSFADIAEQVLDKLEGRLFVAHNARFDYTFLKREFKRLGMDFRATNLCTVKLSRKLFPGHARHSLDALVARHQIVVEDRHRALADARVLWHLWQCWHQQLPLESIRAVLTTLIARPQLPPQLDPALLDDLPEAPGAYAFYDEKMSLLRCKRSANIRLEVLAHFSADKQHTALVRNTWHLKWQESAGELGAKLYELGLLARANAGIETSPETEALCAWQLAEDVNKPENNYRPQLVYADELDFARLDNLFGLYANRRQATQALRKIVEAQRLCFTQTGLSGKLGQACTGYAQKTCRGACVGKESAAMHQARLMAALAKFKLTPWPYAGAVALVERDEFGMREDFHVFKHWHYLGTAQRADTLLELLETSVENKAPAFDADIYRLLLKVFNAGKIRVMPLAEPSQ